MAFPVAPVTKLTFTAPADVASKVASSDPAATFRGAQGNRAVGIRSPPE
jgi:hypothetical protein